MNQVGDTVTFVSVGTQPGSVQPCYIWKFWDASVLVSGQNQGTVLKQLNLGGNPAEGGVNGTPGPPYVIPYRCEVCDAYGTTVRVFPGTIAVNNPPVIYGNPTVTPDNQPYPFTTQVQVEAYDLENNGVGFYWYYGTNAIGGRDVTTGPVSVPGTYYGTLIGANCNAYTNTLTTPIYNDGTVLTCKIVDNDGGTNLFAVPVEGYDPSAPLFSVAAVQSAVTLDAATLPDAIIAPGQTVDFTSFASDTTPGGIVFTWYFYGSNGWDGPGIPHLDFGTITPLAQGYRNDYIRDISSEMNTGLRTALVTATNMSTGKTAMSSVDVNLVQNNAPVMTAIRIYSLDGSQDLTGTPLVKQLLPAHTIVRFSGTALDANDDVVTFKWDLTTPATNDVSAGSGPANYTLYGRDAYVDITSWPATSVYTTLGQVTPVDKYGAPGISASLPQVTLA